MPRLKLKKTTSYLILIYLQLVIQLIVSLAISLKFDVFFSIESLFFLTPQFLFIFQLYNIPYCFLNILILPIVSFFYKKNKQWAYTKQVLFFIVVLVGLYLLALLIGLVLITNNNLANTNDFLVWPLGNTKNETNPLFITYLLGNSVFGMVYLWLYNKQLKPL